EAKKVLDRVEMTVKTRSIARFTFGDADDQPARAFERGAGAAPLVIRRRHDGINAPGCYFFDGAGRNAVRLEILPLIGLQFVEPGDAGFHRRGIERLSSHRDYSIGRVHCRHRYCSAIVRSFKTTFAGAIDHSALMPANLITLPHF